MSNKKNKTLPILLMIPFVISLVTFYSVKALKNEQKVRPSEIEWAYKDKQGFIFNEDNKDFEGYKLEASALVEDENYKDAPWNDLVWEVINDDTSNPVAEIIEKNGSYYLKPLSEGTCKVVCSDKDGTISKSFVAKFYSNGSVTINLEQGSSGYSVENEHTFGLYDLNYETVKLDGAEKTLAKFKINTDVILKDENRRKGTFIEKYSSNIKCSQLTNNTYEVTCLKPGDAFIRVASEAEPALSDVFNFKIEDDAFNIHNYNDLLMVSNFSKDGKKAVLQTNLESLNNTFNKNNEKRKSTELFGNYNKENKRFSFDKEIYRFDTTYNHEFIEQWNNAYKDSPVNQEVKSGIRIQKDLIGNGYKINMHELCFPTHGHIGDNGKLNPNPDLDLFGGPLSYVTIGDINKLKFIEAYGQDNSGLLIDGDNVTLKDVRLSNTGEVSNMYDYAYTGSVVEVNGDNVNIKDCIIGNGKTAVRAFSTNNLLIDNCILRNAGEFILKVGSNKYAKTNKQKNINLDNENDISFEDFYNEQGSNSSLMNANKICMNYFKYNGYPKLDDCKKIMQITQSGLDNDVDIKNDGYIKVKDTSFNNSGIFSIAFESIFNGPYLYNGMPVSGIVKQLNSSENHSLCPSNIGGTSFPVTLEVEGNTNFYDWKDISKIDVSCLIEENLSALAKSFKDDFDVDINIDLYFPIKEILRDVAKEKHQIITKGGKDYINTAVAWYGGGLNKSTYVENNNLNTSSPLGTEPLIADLLEASLTEKYNLLKDNEFGRYFGMLTRCVCLATGMHPFRFYTGALTSDGGAPLFGEVPHVQDLINNRRNNK